MKSIGEENVPREGKVSPNGIATISGKQYKLKPCPFCGSLNLKVDETNDGYYNTLSGSRHRFNPGNKYYEYYRLFRICCKNCRARGDAMHEPKEVVEKWNSLSERRFWPIA